MTDDNRLKAVEFGLARQAAREDYEALAKALRARAKVEINPPRSRRRPAAETARGRQAAPPPSVPAMPATTVLKPQST